VLSIFGADNFSRPGCESNRHELKQRGINLFHGDPRQASNLDGLPAFDWVIDAAANPSVPARVDGKTCPPERGVRSASAEKSGARAALAY
jgi:CDP-paratose 2-epimerase